MPKRPRPSRNSQESSKEAANDSRGDDDNKDDDFDCKPAAKPDANHSGSPVDNDATMDDSNRLVTPHMQRLLRLIEEGTTESAQMAAGQLATLTKQSSALVLWEVLGRLQAMLESMDSWKARQNAAMAMEGVAGNLPVTDQQSFFQVNHQQHADDNNDRLHTTLLRISDISVESVLTQGQELYVAAPSIYVEQRDEAGEKELQELDQEAADFVQERIRNQRRILSERLGLATVEDALQSQGGGRSLMAEIISKDDLDSRYCAAPTTSKRSRQEKKKDNRTIGIKNILVSEMNKVSSLSMRPNKPIVPKMKIC